MALSAGRVLQGRYRIDALLAEGGMGAVYRATDLALEGPVAVKENRESSEAARRQFTQEAQILARLRHPNLPRVSDHFSIPGLGQYLVMDFVEGPDLAQVARAGPVPEALALAWIRQVLEALDYLHSHTPPIIHRDVKPANVKITPQGRAMLVDFGLAKTYEAGLSTRTGALGATPGFSPPEQYGTARTDARSDLYAAGASLYMLLTGRRPPESVELAMGSVRLAPPRQVRPGLSQRSEAAILRAMQVQPGRRFQTVAEFLAALPGGGGPSAAPRAPAGRAGRPWRAVGWAGAVLLAALVAVAGFWPRPRPALPSAQATATRLQPQGGQVLAPATLEPASTATASPTLSPTDTPAPTASVTETLTPEPAPAETATETPVPDTPTPEPTATSAEEAAVYGRVRANALSVRPVPSSQYGRLPGFLVENVKIRILCKKSGERMYNPWWYSIVYEGYAEAYVSGYWITLEGGVRIEEIPVCVP